MSAENVGGMRPQMGDTTISLPVTLDYSSGRVEKEKTKKITAIVAVSASFLVAILLLFNGNINFFVRLGISVAIVFVAQFVTRYLILKEKRIREDYKSLVDSDYELNTSTIWGIYSVDENYPHICRFKNGKSGIFIKMNKDVILGKYDEAEYNHYEAISDAYNLAGGSKVQICHIDYMDNVGTDERLEESFASLTNMSNPDLRDLLMDIFSFQQEQMMRKVTTFDVYLFQWSGSDTAAWSTVQNILACFLDANYRSFHILDSEDIRDLVKTLFNLEEYSVLEGTLNAFETTASTGIVPIKVVKENGLVDIIGKTVEEKQEEMRLKKEQEEAKEAEKKRRKKGKRLKEDDEEVLDIF